MTVNKLPNSRAYEDRMLLNLSFITMREYIPGNSVSHSCEYPVQFPKKGLAVCLATRNSIYQRIIKRLMQQWSSAKPEELMHKVHLKILTQETFKGNDTEYYSTSILFKQNTHVVQQYTTSHARRLSDWKQLQFYWKERNITETEL